MWADPPKTFIHIHSFGHILVFSTFAQLYIYHILNMCSKSHCAFWSTLSFELPALTTESLISMQSRSFSLRKEEKQRVENQKLSCLKKFSPSCTFYNENQISPWKWNGLVDQLGDPGRDQMGADVSFGKSNLSAGWEIITTSPGLSGIGEGDSITNI